MKKKYSILIALMMYAGFASAQSAVKVLEDMVNQIQNNAIKTNFGLVVKQPGSDNLHRIKGAFLLQGNKFVLNTTDMDVYFDGTTQWAYAPEINEVSITTPTDKELAETNPLALLAAYKSKSTIRFAKNSDSSSYLISLTPKAKESDVKTIFVRVSKANKQPTMVQLFDKKGGISTISLSGFNSGVKTNADSFKFNTSLYEGIEINDLR